MSEAQVLAQIRQWHFDRLVKDAAFLCREFLGAIEARRFQNDDGGKTLHVYDTDVLLAKASPAQYGPLDDNGGAGSGQLLPRLYPVDHPDWLNEEGRKIVARQRKAERRLATKTAMLLTQEAFKANTLPNGEEGRVLMLPGQHGQYGIQRDFRRRYAKLVNEDEAAKQQERRKTHENEVRNGLRNMQKASKQYPIEGMLSELMEAILEREASRSTGAVQAANALDAIDAKCLSWDTFENHPVTGDGLTDRGHYSDEEVEGAAFLEWLFHDRLRTKVHANLISPESVQQDAQALSELALFNRRLLLSGSRTRVVLVTADRNLVKASYGEESGFGHAFDGLIVRYLRSGSYGEKTRKERLIRAFIDLRSTEAGNIFGGWIDRFGLHYVRHLHSFGHGPIASNRAPTEFSTIFSGMFAKDAEPDFESAVHLESRIRSTSLEKVSGDLSEDYSAAVKKWVSLVKQATRTQRLTLFTDEKPEIHQLLLRLIKEDVIEKSNKLDDQVDDSTYFEAATDWLIEYLDRIRDSAMLTFSNIGTDLLMSESRPGDLNWAVRNPPDLSFKVLHNCAHIFSRLTIPNGYPHEKIPEFDNDFEQITHDIPGEYADRDRLESHLKFLVLGAAFAAAEKWSVARDHAERAVAIVKRADRLGAPLPSFRTTDGETTVNFSGREAYFLSSVCARTLAEKPHDLKLALTFLADCDKALMTDMEATGKEYNDVDRIQLRNQTERVSIAQAEYYLTRFNCHNDIKNGKKKDCICDHDFDVGAGTDDLVAAIPPERRAPTCADCRKSYQELMETGNELMASDIIREKYLLDSDSPSLTDMSLALYIVQFHAIHEYWKNQPRIDAGVSEFDWMKRDKLEEAVGCLQRILDGELHVMSFLARKYLLVGKLMLDPTDIPSTLKGGGFEREFSNLRRRAVTHYDEWRLRRLKEYVEFHVKSQSAVA